jgi:hypothetical protein
MTTIFNQLKAVTEQAATSSKGKKPEYFSSYTNDLYEIDKEICEDDAQAGDVYIHVIKENGCGTFMVRCIAENDYMLKESGEKSIFHKVTFTGINEGSIKKVDYKTSLDIYNSTKERTGRIPRRNYLKSELGKTLGFESTSVFSHTKFNNDFIPKNKDKTLIKLLPDSSGVHLAVQVVRTKIAPPDKGEWGFPQKKLETYYFPLSHKAKQMLRDNEVYFLLESTKSGHGTVTPTTKRVFESGLRKIQEDLKNENSASELSL